jgi:hypothetical protein
LLIPKGFPWISWAYRDPGREFDCVSLSLLALLTMRSIQYVRCPNCGRQAEREHLASRQVLQLECPCCDYLLITCSLTGRVIEAYAPGMGSWPVQWG